MRGPGGDRADAVKRVHAMPFGAELREDGARFRLWAPAAGKVEVRIERDDGPVDVALSAEGDGWFGGRVGAVRAGARYRFRIDEDLLVPDPASRYQPEGVHGPSELIDPAAFPWTDAGWSGRPFEETVLYEVHVGAFTREGRFDAVAARLDHLAALGVTALELMPVAEFAGARGWGYDGVLPFAPARCYGEPEDLKRLVQEAHQRGLMVLLDVVYNHFGPEGNYLHRYAPDFFTRRHRTDWGEAIDFHAPAVRAFFIENALYWLEEFHFDGLRLDAVHAIRDDSEPPFLEELACEVRRRLAGRTVHLVLENDGNEARWLGRGADGAPSLYDAQWNDDLHHAFHVLLTGECDGYYRDYAEQPVRQLGRCLAEGFAYQGDPSPYRGGQPRGEPSGRLPPTAFVGFLQNHDQVGNRALGERLSQLAEADALEAAASILLLAPAVPLLFMGEEWGCEQPFPFFCDFRGELADAVREGRRREFARFAAFRSAKARERIPDPNAPATFAAAVLRWETLQDETARARLALHRELLDLRRREIAPRLPGARAGAFGVIGSTGLRVRWTLGDGGRLELVAQLGAAPEPVPAEAPRGRLLFARPRDWPGRVERGELPPRSVAWLLEGPAGVAP
jgi:maltooligosyltrehalose trehalohydrolase